MPKQQHQLSIIVQMWHNVYAMVEKAGFFKTIIVAILAVFISMCGYLILNPGKIFEQIIKYQEKVHDERVQLRLQQNPIIEGLLSKVALETSAHRVWLIEFHNGQSNLSGLPFLYGRMSIQISQDTVVNSAKEFQELNLDQFRLVSTLIKDGLWSGSTDELMKVDPPLAHKLLINSTRSIIMVTLYGAKSAIGVMGVSFTSDTGYNEDHIESIVRRYSYQVAANIDMTKLDN